MSGPRGCRLGGLGVVFGGALGRRRIAVRQKPAMEELRREGERRLPVCRRLARRRQTGGPGAVVRFPLRGIRLGASRRTPGTRRFSGLGRRLLRIVDAPRQVVPKRRLAAFGRCARLIDARGLGGKAARSGYRACRGHAAGNCRSLAKARPASFQWYEGVQGVLRF